MRFARLAVALALSAVAACGYANFRGAIPITSGANNLRAVGAFSPDGGRFVVVESRLSRRHAETAELRVYRRGPTPDLPGEWRLVNKLQLGDFFAIDAAFSPNGRTIAVGGWARGGSVALWDVRKGRLSGLLPGSSPVTQAVAFGPDGDFLVTAGIDGRIRIWDLHHRRLRAVVKEEPALLRQARFPLVVGARSEWIAYARTDGQVVFADPTTGIQLDVRATGGREIYDLARSIDGRWLAAATDAGVRLWDMARPGSAPRQLTQQRAPSIAFFPDGRTLLASGESPRNSHVLDIASGRVVYAFEERSAPARNPALESASTFAGEPRARRAWDRAMRTLPSGDAAAAMLRTLVATYVHYPSIHRVAISPEDLWVAFFEGGRGGLVITERHYKMRQLRSGAPAAPQTPVAPTPPRKPLTPAERKRLMQSI